MSDDGSGGWGSEGVSGAGVGFWGGAFFFRGTRRGSFSKLEGFILVPPRDILVNGGD